MWVGGGIIKGSRKEILKVEGLILEIILMIRSGLKLLFVLDKYFFY